MLATTFTVWTEAGPRIWYQCVHRVLAAHGFTMAQSDNCVFYKSNCVVCVYVDDFLIAAATSHEIEQVQHAWQAEFQLNDLSIPRSFLGIQFDYHSMGPCPFTNTSTTEGALRLWHGDLSAEVYADESQANAQSLSKRGTFGQGSKSSLCDCHRFVDVSDGWHAIGYCVCTGHVESLHVPAAIASPSRSAAIASLHQSHAISSHYLPQWAANRVHGRRLRGLRRH